MALDFLIPISSRIREFVGTLSRNSIGANIQFVEDGMVEELPSGGVAIIGVLDNRGNEDADLISLDNFRKQFYQLYPGNWKNSIYDFGDVPQGYEIKDTYFVLSEIVQTLVKKNIVPIIVGGSQDMTYGVYRAYDQLDQMVNLVSIDACFDLGQQENANLSSSYLSKIIVDEPCNLFNFSNIGFQTYFNSQEEIDLVEKLYFDTFRLGEISSNIKIAEPVFRDADIVSLDLNSVESGYSGSSKPFMPNGFTGKEICALSRYAGIGDKVGVFGVFNYKGSYTESALVAQIVWYFLEGFNYRLVEVPGNMLDSYVKYTVLIDEEEYVFYKSQRTEKWWMAVADFSPSESKKIRNTLLPCSYEDYLMACEQEIPPRWWKFQNKTLL